MSDTDGYNGWTNRATWAVALHVNNDQGWQEQVHELAQEYLGEEAEEVPEDYPVRVLADDEAPKGRTTCGTCGRSWDDDVVTSMTPAPSGRCPFEYYHAEEDDVNGFRDALEQSVREIVDPAEYIETFGDIPLSTWVDGPGMAARDIGDLDEVNWHELAESFIRDVREDDGWEAPAAPVPVATLIRDGLPNATGHQALYRLKPALSGHEYVVVSATSVPGGGPETYIFPADANGAVTDWLGMDGSYKGGLSHAKALEGAGYAIEG